MDPLAIGSDADWVDKQVVIIATYLPTGELQANAVVKHDGAVNAALAAYHSNQQAKLRADAKAERDSLKAQLAEIKAAESAEKVFAAAALKAEKFDRQIAKVKAKKEEAERMARNLAQANTLLEPAEA
jgi:ribosome-associated translation inhibitor RaiA